MARFPRGRSPHGVGEDARRAVCPGSAFRGPRSRRPSPWHGLDKNLQHVLRRAATRAGSRPTSLLQAANRCARRMATTVSDKFDFDSGRRAESPIGGPVLEEDIAAYAVCTLRDTIEAGEPWSDRLVTEGDHRAGGRADDLKPPGLRTAVTARAVSVVADGPFRAIRADGGQSRGGPPYSRAGPPQPAHRG